MSRVKLGDVAREHKETIKGDKSNYPIVGLEHLIPENIRLTQWDYNKENTFTKVFRKGCVLFGRRRAYLKKAVYADFDGICSGDITVIEAIPGKIFPELLPFVIQNDDLFDYAVGKSAGSLSPRVKWEHLKNYEFELPEIEKQHELAKILWSIVETKESYERLMGATDELVKSQFIELLNKTENKCIKKMSELVSYLPKSSMNAADGKEIGLYPFFTSGLEQNKFTDNYLYDDECLIIGNGGVANIQYYNGKFATGSHSFVTKSKIPTVRIRYLYSYFYSNMDILEEGFRGVGIKNIPKEYINGINIPVPSIEQQDNLILLFEQSDKSKFELENCIKNAVSMYKKILKEYLG